MSGEEDGQGAGITSPLSYDEQATASRSPIAVEHSPGSLATKVGGLGLPVEAPPAALQEHSKQMNEGVFSAAELERQDFDAYEYVALARRSTPLDELCGSLAGHLAELRASLIDAINQDYAAFVGMASNLRGLDKAVSKVQSPWLVHAFPDPCLLAPCTRCHGRCILFALIVFGRILV